MVLAGLLGVLELASRGDAISCVDAVLVFDDPITSGRECGLFVVIGMLLAEIG